jgi:hypothetical protein
MNYLLLLAARYPVARFLILILLLMCGLQAQAQPFITSVVPANGAVGVSPSAAVVFTFSEQMDTALTIAQFIDPMSPFTPIPTTQAWSANDTVLTCTPTPAFPSSRNIFWIVSGESLIGDPMDEEFGSFTTSGGGGGTGTGTNRITSFGVGKAHFYNQTSAAAPTPDPDTPYLFTATTTLASNRSANAVNVTLPTAAVSNLTQNFFQPESFFLFADHTNLSSFNATFPAGAYMFNVTASSSNQQVTVNLPAGLTQPNAPHIANYAAAQSINAAQPFQISWGAFQGGTAADHISVSIGETFQSPDAGAPGALNGTATSITIPAGTLQAGSDYSATISFFRSSGSSNASYSAIAYVATSTDFDLATSSGTETAPLILTNAAWTNGTFTFDVISSPGQSLTVDYSSTMLTNQWQTLLITNSTTGLARITHSATNRYLFYRARKNP